MYDLDKNLVKFGIYLNKIIRNKDQSYNNIKYVS